MKISLIDRTERLPSLVRELSARPLNYTDADLAPPQLTRLVVAPPGAIDDLRSCDVTAFFDYRIFPDAIVVGHGSWRPEGRAMREGDVIVQQVSVPPGPVGIRCIFAVRIIEVVRSATEMAFSYGTLAGHVESGIARFAITLGPEGVTASISVRARKRGALPALAERVAVRPMQAMATRRALERMRAELLRANPRLTTP